MLVFLMVWNLEVQITFASSHEVTSQKGMVNSKLHTIQTIYIKVFREKTIRT
jgi:hypothetical protein